MPNVLWYSLTVVAVYFVAITVRGIFFDDSVNLQTTPLTKDEDEKELD